MSEHKRERNPDELDSSDESCPKKPSVDYGDSSIDLLNDLADIAAALPSNSSISAQAESFLWDHAEIFDDLLISSSPKKVVDYLAENPISQEYYTRLYQAFTALINKHSSEKILKTVKNKSTGKRRKRIDIGKLLNKLKPCNTVEGCKFLSVLDEGISSWRLLKLFDLYHLSSHDEKKPILDALIWLEKRRSFIKACMSRDMALMRWLDHNKQSEMKTTLTKFTITLQNLFSQTKSVSIIEIVQKRIGETLKFEESIEPVVYNMPLIMDIRMLWHTLSFKHLIELQDEIKNSDLLIDTDNNFLIENESIAQFFFSTYPSPLTCFLEAFNGLEKETRSDYTLKVDHDILMWLFLSHVDNAELANTILTLSAGVDVVAEAYAAHQKERIAAPLAESMASILSPIHNSPTKEKRKPDPELVTRSPRRKIENALNEISSLQIK